MELTFEPPILVVDGDSQVRSLIRAILSKHGFPSVEACEGMSGLSTIQDMDGAISLIVSGLSMPGLDGAAFARLVKTQFPNIPILLISGGTTGWDCLPGDAFLAKPFTPGALAEAVHRLYKAPSTQKRATAWTLHLNAYVNRRWHLHHNKKRFSQPG